MDESSASRPERVADSPAVWALIPAVLIGVAFDWLGYTWLHIGSLAAIDHRLLPRAVAGALQDLYVFLPVTGALFIATMAQLRRGSLRELYRQWLIRESSYAPNPRSWTRQTGDLLVGLAISMCIPVFIGIFASIGLIGGFDELPFAAAFLLYCGLIPFAAIATALGELSAAHVHRWLVRHVTRRSRSLVPVAGFSCAAYLFVLAVALLELPRAIGAVISKPSLYPVATIAFVFILAILWAISWRNRQKQFTLQP